MEQKYKNKDKYYEKIVDHVKVSLTDRIKKLETETEKQLKYFEENLNDALDLLDKDVRFY